MIFRFDKTKIYLFFSFVCLKFVDIISFRLIQNFILFFIYVILFKLIIVLN